MTLSSPGRGGSGIWRSEIRRARRWRGRKRRRGEGKNDGIAMDANFYQRDVL